MLLYREIAQYRKERNGEMYENIKENEYYK